MTVSSYTSILETDKRIRKASPNLEAKVEMYKLFLASTDAIEIHMSNLTHPLTTITIYDIHRTKLAEAEYSPNAPIILPFFPEEDGLYYVQLTIGPDPDPQHTYQLHVDKYKRLSGIINQSEELSAENGPYMIGPEDVIIAAGTSISFEAGTSINVRCQNKIVVQNGASISFRGEPDKPVVVIGAIDDTTAHRWNQLVLSPLAEATFQHIIVQYDNDEDGVDFLTSAAPFVAIASSVEEFESTIAKANYVERAAVVSPSSRLDFIKTWFQQSSPYCFHIFGDLLPELYFGIDVTTFARWETDTKRINEERVEAGEINYWDFVNGNFTADLIEATLLFANNESSPELRIQRLIDFLIIAQKWRRKHGCFSLFDMLDPFHDHDEEFYKTFEQMSSAFWLAHNTSIIHWDTLSRELGIWQKESFFERQFINSVMIRLHFAADLPFSLPGYGNNIPPVGFLGISIHFGPFRYPEDYPAPGPEFDVNYGELSTATYVKFMFESLLNGKTNPVYTWWIPTQADKELFRTLQEKGISLDSPPEDWDREFVQPARKTLEEIRAYYLNPTLREDKRTMTSNC
ncbi:MULTISPECIES: hypothetical protein [Brevibacillus]|uniref:hypothetical protein n=1 Tax=Brevibacillus TaxID=55080 RepID=UPI000D109501|nr:MULTISPECIES: hypothetical protein [Brevibacillus]MED1945236.1 hypothetical protein [Brevibacillus formosus]MED1998641.1 hypothetical protein [Brevibacillus formosus]MED2083610.1 hypothetical protein [Brevibacillus formosus]PSK21001.1 hypothetical protein C7R94_02710 [Brevibacillus sp. NRRL NRS-603]